MTDTSKHAFPEPFDDHGGGERGMTLREYYAGQALVGMLAKTPAFPAEITARIAVKFADALIASLETDHE